MKYVTSPVCFHFMYSAQRNTNYGKKKENYFEKLILEMVSTPIFQSLLN